MKNKYYLLSDYDSAGGVATQVQYITKFNRFIKEIYKKYYLKKILLKNPFLPKSIIATSFMGIAIGLTTKIFNRKSKLIYFAYFNKILDKKIRGKFVSSVLKIVLHFCDLIVPFDKETFNELSKYNYKISNSLIGIACEKPKVTRILKEINQITRILWVGRLVEFKVINLKKIIDTVSNNSNLELTIIGEGPLENLLHEKYSNCRRIKFLGKLSIEEIIYIANKSDISIGMATTLLTLFNCSTVAVASFAYSENLYLPQDPLDITYSEPHNRSPVEISNIIEEVKFKGKKEFFNTQDRLYNQIIKKFNKDLKDILQEIKNIENKKNFLSRLFIGLFAINLLGLAEIYRKIKKKPIL